jgi:hypothetical protein
MLQAAQNAQPTEGIINGYVELVLRGAPNLIPNLTLWQGGSRHGRPMKADK